MSNKRAIRTDTLNFEAFENTLTPKLSQILENSKHYGENQHPFARLYNEFRHHAIHIMHPQTNVHMNTYISDFYNVSYQYDQITDYAIFFDSLANEMKSYFFSKLTIDVAKAFGIYNEMYALHEEYQAVQYRKDPNTNRRIDWNEQRKLQEPFVEKFNELLGEFSDIWNTAIRNQKNEMILHDNHEITIEYPKIHYMSPCESEEGFMESFVSYHIKNNAGTNQSMSVLKDDSRAEFLTRLKKNNPILYLGLCQWMEFMAIDNGLKEIKTVALVSTSTNRCHTSFYNCEMDDISNQNYNKNFYQPINEIFPAFSVESVSKAIINLDSLVIHYNDLYNTFLPLCEVYTEAYESNEEKTEASLKSAINTNLSALYSVEENKPHVVDYIAWVHGFNHTLMADSIITDKNNNAISYMDFNRNQQLTTYFSYHRNQSHLLDISAIGLDEDDRMELSRMFNRHIDEQEQSHDWTMRNHIKQMTAIQNRHEESIEQQRKAFKDLIAQ